MHAATGDKFKYNEIYFIITSEVNKTCSTTKYDTSDSEIPSYEISGNLVIPSKVTGPRGVYTVTGIENRSFYFNECITSVTIPNTVTEIGPKAFEKCLGLNNIKLPNSIKLISHDAFRECAMSSIEIPSSVESIGYEAFGECHNLTEVIINDCKNELIVDNHLFSGSPVKKIYFGRNWRYAKNAAYDLRICSDSLEVTLGNMMTEIPGGAFNDYTGALSIDIPDHIRSIGSHAFSGCSGLTSIRLPATIDSIKICTFAGCINLQAIDIPNSVKIINGSAFSGCSSLKTITIPNSVEAIGNAFEECTNLKQLIIEDGDTEIKIDIVNTSIEDAYFGREWVLNRESSHTSSALKTVKIGDRVKKSEHMLSRDVRN